MHQQFLARIREDPADHLPWLVYADWLDEQGDPTGSFVRLSLALTEGRTEFDGLEAMVAELEQLLPLAHADTRELLADYRSGLPTRFRVLNTYKMGENPPTEMFAYARTVAVGFLETGILRPGTDLGVGWYSDGLPRRLQGIEVFARTLNESVAGREPVQVALMWLGHLSIESGRVLIPTHTNG